MRIKQVRALRLQLDAASAMPPVNGFAHVTSQMEERERGSGLQSFHGGRRRR